MNVLTIVLGLAATTIANPLPQAIDAAAVNNAPIPSPKSVPWGAGSETVPYDAKAVAGATYNSLLSSLKSSSSSKRSLKARTQAGPCGALPSGYGPTPDPDTVAAFLSYPAFASTANNAATPDGYVNVFTNLNGSTSLPMGYLGYDTLQSYDVQGCATKCNSVSGCIAFNIYFERDPTILPADSCPNPPSTTNIKCSYWGAPVGPDTATNYGQVANSFQIVQAGSNGYNAQNVGNVPSYNGDFLDSAAIDAPNQCNSFITSKLFNDGQPFDPNRCAAACQAETDYNAQYLNSRAVCRFFNTYVLSKDGVPQGQYCSLYTASWDDSYATNTGYTSGSDTYTISYSYSYSNTTDPRLDDCTCGIGSTCNTGVNTTTTSGSSVAAGSSTVATVLTITSTPTTTGTSTTSVGSLTVTPTTTPSPSSTTTSTTSTTSVMLTSSSSTSSTTSTVLTTTSTSTIAGSTPISTTVTPTTTQVTTSSTSTTSTSTPSSSSSTSTSSTITSTTGTTSSKTTQTSTTSSNSSTSATTSTSSTIITSKSSSTGVNITSSTTSTSCTTTSKATTTTLTSSSSTSSTSSTTKALSTTSTTLSTSTKTTSTASATPTPKGPCFKAKIKGPSYCNNAYIGLDSTGALSYSASNPTTFYLDDSAIIRTKDGKYGKCPNAKTSDKNGSITFGTNSDPAAVTCSGSGSSVSCKVAGQSVTSLWTSSSQGAVVLGNKPSSGKWDQVSVSVEQCSCSA